MNTQTIPAPNTLLTKMPSGREIHTTPQFQVPVLGPELLDAMRLPPDREENPGDYSSEEEDIEPLAPGAYPGTGGSYGGERQGYY